MEYTWKIKQLTKQHSGDLDNIIVGTRWEVTGTDEDGYAGTFVGATPFPLSTVDTNNFTPYEELTETQVLTWIKNTVSGSALTSYWDHISERIQKAIDAEKNIKITIDSNDLPWSPTSGSGEVGLPPV